MAQLSFGGKAVEEEYLKYDATLSERTKAERKAGRKRNIEAAATALIAEACNSFGIVCTLNVDVTDDDEANWGVTYEGNDFKITDRWADFPSEEFRTALMLLGQMK